jgi:hypothetical protein
MYIRIIFNEGKEVTMVKRTFSIPDDKVDVYERFKELVPEVSGGLVGLMEEYVRKHEAIQAKMEPLKVYKGTYDRNRQVYAGQEFSFYGTEIATGTDIHEAKITVFYTKKGKFLVYAYGLGENDIEYMGFTVYENYEDLAVKISRELLTQCRGYLNMNSNAKTSIELDV